MAKKITAIVSLVIIGLLIIATIVMANVNVDYKINCAKPDKIYVQYGSSTAQPIAYFPGEGENGEVYNEIWSLISNASKQNSLSALFNGNLNKKAEVVVAENPTNGLTGVSANMFVTFVYNNPQNLMEGNKKYKDGDGQSAQYTELVFAVTEMNEQTSMKVYIKDYVKDPTASTKYYTRYYLLTANLGDLHTYLQDIKGKK